MKKTFQQVFDEFNIPMEGRQAAIDAIEFPGDIYLFGVWSGVSAKLVSDYLAERQIPYDSMFGFDSFIGLPEEQEGVPRHQGHDPGKYSSTELYRKSLAETIKLIEEGVGNPKLKLIQGFYDKVLDENLVKRERMQVASFVDIDVDLYLSSVEVLTFLFKNKLVGRGTTVYFDDWGATEEYKGGESLAWKQMTDSFNVRYEHIYTMGDKRPYVSKVFKML